MPAAADRGAGTPAPPRPRGARASARPLRACTSAREGAADRSTQSPSCIAPAAPPRHDLIVWLRDFLGSLDDGEGVSEPVRSRAISSSCFSLRTPDGNRPPYRFFQRRNGASELPISSGRLRPQASHPPPAAGQTPPAGPWIASASSVSPLPFNTASPENPRSIWPTFPEETGGRCPAGCRRAERHREGLIKTAKKVEHRCGTL